MAGFAEGRGHHQSGESFAETHDAVQGARRALADEGDAMEDVAQFALRFLDLIEESGAL